MSENSDKPQGQKNDSGNSVPQYEIEGRAVRANMEKLRALRLAKEAAEAASAPAKTVRKAGGKRTAAAKPAKAAPAKLSDWLADQRKGGFRT